MDPDDFDFSACEPNTNPDEPEAPDFRVSIQRSGEVRAIDWGPWLMSWGPSYSLMISRERAGVAIADLRVIRDDDGNAAEVVVDFHAGGSPAHREVLARWAAFVGYRRVWFDEHVHDLEPAPGGRAVTRCSGCGGRFIEAKAQFWAHVRRRGAFPGACGLCGADLPQWTPPAAPAGARPRHPQESPERRTHARQRTSRS